MLTFRHIGMNVLFLKLVIKIKCIIAVMCIICMSNGAQWVWHLWLIRCCRLIAIFANETSALYLNIIDTIPLIAYKCTCSFFLLF